MVIATGSMEDLPVAHGNRFSCEWPNTKRALVLAVRISWAHEFAGWAPVEWEAVANVNAWMSSLG